MPIPFFYLNCRKESFSYVGDSMTNQELIPVLNGAKCQTLVKCFVDALSIMQYAAGMTNTSCENQ